MASRGPWAGTKRRARLFQEEDRRTAATNRSLAKVVTGASQIKSQEQLEELLEQVDPRMREEVKKLLVSASVIGTVAKVRKVGK